jgi:hypothetical protein
MIVFLFTVHPWQSSSAYTSYAQSQRSIISRDIRPFLLSKMLNQLGPVRDACSPMSMRMSMFTALMRGQG